MERWGNFAYEYRRNTCVYIPILKTSQTFIPYLCQFEMLSAFTEK